MSSDDISNELKAIADNFNTANYGVVVQQALLLIEKKLREVIQRDLSQLDRETQLKIYKHLGTKNKSVADLGMGEIVGLLRETRFLDAWKKQFHKELQVFETINLNKLVNLRNQTAHGTQSVVFTQQEAELVIHYQKLIFQVFENSVSSKKTATKSYNILREIKIKFILVSSILIIYLLIQPDKISGYLSEFIVSKIIPKQISSDSTVRETIYAETQKDKVIVQSFRNCNLVTTIPQEECETLVEFYNSTDGTNWGNNEGWLKTNFPCQWKGVKCKNGRVVEINLSLNRLKEKIPNLSQLKELKELYLFGNQLNGRIPDLSTLENLEYLSISRNVLCRALEIQYPDKWQQQVNQYPLCNSN